MVLLEMPVEATGYAQLLVLSLSDCQHAEDPTKCRYGHRQTDIPASWVMPWRRAVSDDSSIMNWGIVFQLMTPSGPFSGTR
jgi:hypothetical protein